MTTAAEGIEEIELGSDASGRFRFDVEFDLELGFEADCECRLVVELEFECGGVNV